MFYSGYLSANQRNIFDITTIPLKEGSTIRISITNIIVSNATDHDTSLDTTQGSLADLEIRLQCSDEVVDSYYQSAGNYGSNVKIISYQATADQECRLRMYVNVASDEQVFYGIAWSID